MTLGSCSLTPENTTIVLLAAGHGKRMLPLTAETPKPLLKVGHLSLIEHHLMRLSAMGFKHVVINVAYLSNQIINTLGSGTQFELHIDYSDESDTGALETAGGLHKALPLIKSDVFICINADIWTDFDFTILLQNPPQHARLVMVDNPQHNLNGDFGLNSNGQLERLKTHEASKSLTFSGIAIYQRHTVANFGSGKRALAPIFNTLINEQRLDGLKLEGIWSDIGTPERLQTLRQNFYLTHSPSNAT